MVNGVEGSMDESSPQHMEEAAEEQENGEGEIGSDKDRSDSGEPLNRNNTTAHGVSLVVPAACDSLLTRLFNLLESASKHEDIDTTEFWNIFQEVADDYPEDTEKACEAAGCGYLLEVSLLEKDALPVGEQAGRLLNELRESTRESQPVRLLKSASPSVPIKKFEQLRRQTNRGQIIKGRSAKGSPPNNVFNGLTTSLFLFAGETETCSGSFRFKVFSFIDSPPFERFVLVVIIANSICLGMDIPSTRGNDSIQQFLMVAEIVFQALFTIEMLLKVVALGFVLHKHSYLRSYWNVMDCVIVCVGFAMFSPSVENYSVVRLLRVVRPLRVVNRVSKMKGIINALIQSLPGMRDVFLLLAFILVIFAIVGIQLFNGLYHQRCYYSQDDVEMLYQHNPRHDVLLNSSSISPPWTDGPVCDGGICLVQNYSCGESCNEMPCSNAFYGQHCTSDVTGVPSFCTTNLKLYEEKVLNFDNFFYAALLVFKVISLDDWPADMQKAQSSLGWWVWIYFLAITMFGAFFCINLFLAVLSLEYYRAKLESEKEEEEWQRQQDEEAVAWDFADLIEDEVETVDYEDDIPEEALLACTPHTMDDVDVPLHGSQAPVSANSSPCVSRQCSQHDHRESREAREARDRRKSISFIPMPGRRMSTALTDSYRSRRKSVASFSPGEPASPTPVASMLATALILRHNGRHSRKKMPSVRALRLSARSPDIVGRLVAQGSVRSKYSAQEHIPDNEDNSPSQISSAGYLRRQSQPALMSTPTLSITEREKEEKEEKEKEEKADSDVHLASPMLPRSSCSRPPTEKPRRSVFLTTSPLNTPPLSSVHRTSLVHAASTTSRVVRVRRKVKAFVLNDWFGRFMLFVTCFNVCVLTLDHHQAPESLEDFINYSSLVCSLIFICEMLVKWVGLGLKGYFIETYKETIPATVGEGNEKMLVCAQVSRSRVDGFNLFDCILVLISIPELILSTGGGGSSFSALRIFRLARILRLLRRFPTLRKVLLTIVASAIAVVYLFMIMLLFIYIFGILGLQLFERSYPPDFRANFNSLWESFLTVFIVITGEGWATIMREAMIGSSPAAFLYFIPLFVFGNYMIINLFIAILIDEFMRSKAQEAEEKEMEEVTKAANQAKGSIRSVAIAVKTIDRILQESQRRITRVSQVATEIGSAESLPDEPITVRPRKSVLSLSLPMIKSLGRPQSSQFIRHVDSFRRLSDHTPKMENGNNSELAKATSSAIVREQTLQEVALMPKNQRYTVNRQISAVLHSCLWEYGKTLVDLTDEEKADKWDLHGTSLGIFHRTHPVRLAVARIVMDPFFDIVVTMVILVNVIFLSIENPHAGPDLRRALDVGEIVFTALFTLECAMKILVMGFFRARDTNGVPKAYLTHQSTKGTGSSMGPWNRIDIFVVITAFIGFGVKEFTLCRSLRALRLAVLSEGIRVVVTSLIRALGGLANVTIVCVFLWLVFGIMAVQFFKGTFYYCTDPSANSRADCTGYYSVPVSYATGESSKLVPREWKRYRYHFDHLGAAMLTLFEVAVGEGWAEIMFTGIDIRGVDLNPRVNSRPYNSVFFVVFVVVGQFFAMNLFVGMLIEVFTSSKASEEGSILMTPAQRKWVRANKLLQRTRLEPVALRPKIRRFEGSCSINGVTSPVKALIFSSTMGEITIDGVKESCILSHTRYRSEMVTTFIGRRMMLEGVETGNTISGKYLVIAQDAGTFALTEIRESLPMRVLTAVRCACYFIVGRVWFDRLITALIMLNAVFMCMTHYKQSEFFDTMLFAMNWFFVACFTLEATVKITAYGPALYFRDDWNKFDFLLVVSSWIGALTHGPGVSILRVIRFGRMFRLIKRAKNLERLFGTLLHALPSLGNVSLLLIVTFFIFGVVGVSLFGKIEVRDNPGLSEFTNFKNLPFALVTLYQVATTETWTAVMEGCTIRESNSNCSEDKDTCGTGWAVVYFVLFMLAGSFVMLNLFITVVLDEFNNNSEFLEEDTAEEDGEEEKQEDSDDGLDEFMAPPPTKWEGLHCEVTLTTEQKMQLMEVFRNQWLHFDPFATGRLRAGVFIVIMRCWCASGKLVPTEGGEMPLNDLQLLRLFKQLALPVDEEGNVRYVDAVQSLSKQLFTISINDALDMQKFVKARQWEGGEFLMISHYFAVKKICSGWMQRDRQRFKEARERRRDPSFVRSDVGWLENGRRSEGSLRGTPLTPNNRPSFVDDNSGLRLTATNSRQGSFRRPNSSSVKKRAVLLDEGEQASPATRLFSVPANPPQPPPVVVSSPKEHVVDLSDDPLHDDGKL